ncbi:unnamed protein product [Amaranthus hypochondriacus]
MFKYLSFFSIFFVIFHSSCLCPKAYSHSNFNGNITIKWDLISWTPDGYVAVVTIYNYQKHRGIVAPGWNLTWTWAGKEIIWSTIGAQTTNQGDCSKFVENIPHNCEKNPTFVDLMPRTPYNQQIENCCKGGVLAPWSGQAQARAHARSMNAFQISVGSAGTTTTKILQNCDSEIPTAAF